MLCTNNQKERIKRTADANGLNVDIESARRTRVLPGELFDAALVTIAYKRTRSGEIVPSRLHVPLGRGYVASVAVS